MWYVYVLLCEDKSLYTGVTNNLQKRLSDHIKGKGSRYTRSHKPIKFIYQESFETYSQALKIEAQIKRWSRDKKISSLNLYK